MMQSELHVSRHYDCVHFTDRYKELLFGDISAVCGFKRVGYLQRLLQATVSVCIKNRN